MGMRNRLSRWTLKARFLPSAPMNSYYTVMRCPFCHAIMQRNPHEVFVRMREPDDRIVSVHVATRFDCPAPDCKAMIIGEIGMPGLAHVDRPASGLAMWLEHIDARVKQGIAEVYDERV